MQEKFILKKITLKCKNGVIYFSVGAAVGLPNFQFWEAMLDELKDFFIFPRFWAVFNDDFSNSGKRLRKKSSKMAKNCGEMKKTLVQLVLFNPFFRSLGIFG